MDANNNRLIEFLLSHGREENVSFHMPGHKGSRIFKELGYDEVLSKLVDMDVTEIPGADNLFQPETTIKSIMDRYRDYYNRIIHNRDRGSKNTVNNTFLSVGGSSAGLIASILASVDRKHSESRPIVLIARNSHKSVYNGVALSGAQPRYIYPERIHLDSSTAYIAGAITPDEVEKAFSEIEREDDNRTICALVLPSPNYYGVMSDIESIAHICHEKGAVLIVDQAHGAHLAMLGSSAAIPEAAECCGADIVISSTHKTLASFTQTAIINVCSDRIDEKLLADKLQMIESSSPSYILMSSLEVNIDILEKQGEMLSKRWLDNLNYFYNEAKSINGLKIHGGALDSNSHIRFDPTKILLDMTEWGYTGDQLAEALMERGIVMELSDSNIAMAMTGIGNTRDDYDRLLEAIKGIPCGRSKAKTDSNSDTDLNTNTNKDEPTTFPELSMVGQVARVSIIPYPPGIPLIAAGEVITEEAIKEAVGLRKLGHKVLGLE